MQRTSIPWDWGLQFQMDQGELTEGLNRILRCSRQVAVKPDPEAGIRPPQSLIGVSRLFHPEILVEIEATAGA